MKEGGGLREAADRGVRHGGAAQTESPFKSVGGFRRVWTALGHSMRGLALALHIESSFRQELLLAAVLIPLAFWLRLGPLHTVALIGSVMMVLVVELLNSSIEATVDRISLEHHRLSQRAKDLGSAAVLLTLLLCLLTWGLVAGPVLVAQAATVL